MVSQRSFIGKPFNTLEKFLYQSERKKSRIAQHVKNYNEAKKRDKENFYNINDKFKYVTLNNKCEKRKEHTFNPIIHANNSNKIVCYKRFEALNYDDHECITHNDEKKLRKLRKPD